jgi:hypothetical protein
VKSPLPFKVFNFCICQVYYNLKCCHHFNTKRIGVSICLFVCFLFYFGLIFWWYWVQGIALARWELYHWSHTLSPFCFGYFGDRLLNLCPSQPGLPSSYLSSHIIRMTATMPSFLFVQIESHKLFAQAGLKPPTSWSLPPEYLGL